MKKPYKLGIQNNKQLKMAIVGFMMSGFMGLFVEPIVFSIGFKLFVVWMDDKPESAIIE